MSRDTDPRWMSGPPESTCIHCGAYIDEDDFYDNENNWKCHRCGWNGELDECVVCNTLISPRDENFGASICKFCENKGHRDNIDEQEEHLFRMY